ncbi:MAG TPA: NUDIX domain-containing protein [Candidatus Saccharibacteria bacterium]|nr:NUDIX domain-containing protein [Candidatus Saccharibacteria bacterium]
MKKNEPVKKVSAGGVIYHEGKFLVIKWKSQNTIELPKGTVEAGETIEEAALREVFEETGYKASIVKPLNTFQHVFTWTDGITYDKTIHYFLLSLSINKKFKHNRQGNEDFVNLWVSTEDAEKKLSHPDTQEAVRMALELIHATQQQ